MRQSRIRGEGLSYYHCLSRVEDRQFILGDEERDHFVVLMRKLEPFLGLRVVTYGIMSNHFHLLVEGPDEAERTNLNRDSLLRRLGFLYSRVKVDTVANGEAVPANSVPATFCESRFDLRLKNWSAKERD